jgi:hypothetical protein
MTQHRLIYSVAMPELALEPPPLIPIRESTIGEILQVNEDWLRGVVPALNPDQMTAAFGIELPPHVIAAMTRQFPYVQAAQEAEAPPARATAKEFGEKTTCRRFKKSDKDPYHQKTCSICLEDFRSNQKVVTLGCKHDFHIKCARQWLCAHKSSCPVCKKSL